MPLERPDLRAEVVMSSETACVLTRDHPLAAHAVIDAAALRGVPLVLLGQGRRSRVQIEAAFADARVRPNVRIETHTVGSACALAARGVGVAIVNAVLARSYVRQEMALRPFRPSIVHDYAFVTPSAAAYGRMAAEFLTLAQEHFTADGGGP